MMYVKRAEGSASDEVNGRTSACERGQGFTAGS